MQSFNHASMQPCLHASTNDQLRLVEKIIHRLRKKDIEEESNMENQLERMTTDPDVQKGIR